jgi:hypothetical protein
MGLLTLTTFCRLTLEKFVALGLLYIERHRSARARGGEQPLLRATSQRHVDGQAVAPEVAPPAYALSSMLGWARCDQPMVRRNDLCRRRSEPRS